MSAKKTSKSKKVSKVKLSPPIKKQSKPLEKLANKEVSTSKELPQRACIDCHFLVEKQDDTEEAGLEPHEMDPRITYYCVEVNRREPIKSNDYSWIKFPLVCYRGCWTEVYDKEKQHEEVVEKDRRDCPLAYPYTEGMSFEVAKEMHDKKQSNKTEAVVEPDAKVEEAKDITKGKLIDKIPSGTKWTDIEMSLVDKEYKTLDISICGRKCFTATCHEMGLESNHTHKPIKAWWVLMAFAKSENNEIPSTGEALRDFAVSNYEMVPKEGKALFDHIDKLRKALSINFGISDDPVPHSADKEAYETLFRIKDTSYTEEHKKSSQNIEGAKCNECGEVIKKLDHNNLDEEGNYICDKCKGASYDRLSKEGTYGEYPDKDEWN